MKFNRKILKMILYDPMFSDNGKVLRAQSWLKRSEAELRDRIKDCDKYPLAPGNEGYHVLREVLGE